MAFPLNAADPLHASKFASVTPGVLHRFGCCRAFVAISIAVLSSYISFFFLDVCVCYHFSYPADPFKGSGAPLMGLGDPLCSARGSQKSKREQ